MRHAILALPLLALAACQTPQQACLSQGSSQLSNVESLIRETQGNLARGYAVEEDQEVRVERDRCPVDLPDGSIAGVPCDRTEVVDVERAVAIDLDEERRKLDGLLASQTALAAQQAERLRQCVALYPEG